MAATKTNRTRANSESKPAKAIDTADVLAQLESLTERVAAAEKENERLEAALKDAKETGAYTDEFGNKVNILSASMQSINASIHDKPGTLIEKLDNMERMAKMRREPFDRERTRKILCGEEVEDLNHYICDRCGRSELKWNDHPELFDAHVEQHITGKARAYGRRRHIRAVDAEDDETTERALLAKLSEKYGLVIAEK